MVTCRARWGRRMLFFVCVCQTPRLGPQWDQKTWVWTERLADGRGGPGVDKPVAERRGVVSGSVMSVSPHSAELGFTLIKEGLPNSASSSLAPLQPRTERGFATSTPSASLPPSFALFSYSPQHAAHVHPIQKKKLKKTPFLMSVSVPFLSTLPLSTGGGEMHQNTDKLFSFFPPKERPKNA